METRDLYRLAPEDFTAARDEAAKAAKAAGDTDVAKALKAARKPSVSAWLLNLLAAHETDLLEQLLALGPALAQAQAHGQGDDLRLLGAQRRELVGAVTQRAVELAGRSVTAAVRDEVAGTLEAALADSASADAARSGQLVRALSYAGFGGVDLSGAVAGCGPDEKVVKGRTKSARRVRADDDPPVDELAERQAADERRERVAAAEVAALEAAGRLDDAVRACEQAERDRSVAEQRAAQLHEEAGRLRQALDDAEAAAKAAEAETRTAGKVAEQAVEAVHHAQKSEEQARAELDRLRRTR